MYDNTRYMFNITIGDSRLRLIAMFCQKRSELVCSCVLVRVRRQMNGDLENKEIKKIVGCAKDQK